MATTAIKSGTDSDKLVVNYDRHGDVLYISAGPPRPAEGEDYDNGIVLRYSMDGDIPCGVTAIGFKAYRWLDKLPEFVRIVSKHLSVAPRDVESAIKNTIH